ncbi:MAG: S41 family peptidase [Bacteroidetes bacterium]|nr:S41 family peptidase [Bacteroidota bacterium]
MRKIIFLLCAFYLTVNGFAQQSQNLFEISKNLDVFSTLYKQLDVNYVEELKPGELMKTGIDAMLATLDPFTNYIPESDIEDYRFMTTGQYGGIGAMVQKQGEYIVITEPYKGFNADKAGLIAGDKILEINGYSTKGKSMDDVSAFMKGQPGTNLNLLILRDNDEPFQVKLQREVVQIENIPYYGMLDDQTGYIKLNGFTMNAGKEVKEAFVKLRENKNLKGLVFDLRGNGGGLLNEAVNIANIFIDRDQLIVNTKGRLPSSNNTYKTTTMPVDPNIRLVFIVDKNSASASEILAGCMQDLDRAVIIGQRSYGKGLVQNVLPISYNAQVKITVAKYYIPSGRCIQAIDYSHKDAEGNFGHVPDSLITAFKTKNGRVVYDGGGIEPDIMMDPKKLSGIANTLLNKFLIFDFATQFKKTHPTIAQPKDFVITDEIYNEFISFLKDKDYDDYTTQAEKSLADLKKSAEKEKYFASIQPEFETLRLKIAHNKTQDIITFKHEIAELLRDEIVTRYYYQKGRIEASLAGDNEIIRARELMAGDNEYSGILSGAIKKEKTGPTK